MRFGASLLIILILILIILFLGKSRLPDMLANNLSKKLQVSVSIDSINFSLSKIAINHAEIGNVRGYTLPRAFSAKEILLYAPLTAYMREQVVVDEIVVNDIYLGLEFDSINGTQGNWTTILSNFQQAAHLDAKGKKVHIKKLVLNNIDTYLLFRKDGGNVRRLPPIKQIVLTDISTEGGISSDQLASSILGQMLKQVFIEQRLNNMLKGIINDPQKIMDDFIKPFKDIFNAYPKDEADSKYVA